VVVLGCSGFEYVARIYVATNEPDNRATNLTSLDPNKQNTRGLTTNKHTRTPTNNNDTNPHELITHRTRAHLPTKKNFVGVTSTVPLTQKDHLGDIDSITTIEHILEPRRFSLRSW
jgi:hypothetical protein